ncbi:MAG: hypothetical protein SFV51_21600 [Bryobacteraceae bacterium]|nr:hypothetical protein [Bryobacteraceae bacterium]
MDPKEYKERMDRLYDILSGIAAHAGEQSKFRCPYKNRHDQCTANFGCRNKRKPRKEGEPPACASDDKLNYRGAWENQ